MSILLCLGLLVLKFFFKLMNMVCAVFKNSDCFLLFPTVHLLQKMTNLKTHLEI